MVIFEEKDKKSMIINVEEDSLFGTRDLIISMNKDRYITIHNRRENYVTFHLKYHRKIGECIENLKKAFGFELEL